MFVDIVSKKTKFMESFNPKVKLILDKELKIVFGGDETVNRRAVENKNIDLLLNPHLVKHKDGMFFRRSGLNQVLCRLAKENNVIIGFSFSALRDSILMGRVKQNVKLCRKYGVDVALVSLASSRFELRDPLDVMGLGRVLGLTPSESKRAVTCLNKKV